MAIVKVAGGIEVHSSAKGWFECVAVFPRIPSDVLYRVAYPSVSTFDVLEGLPNIRTRGLPGDMTYQLKRVWDKKEYPCSGEGMCWLWLSEILAAKEIQGAAMLSTMPDTYLNCLIAQMQYWEAASNNAKARLVIWGEIEDSGK